MIVRAAPPRSILVCIKVNSDLYWTNNFGVKEGILKPLRCPLYFTIKGGSRRAEKSRKALMMMMSARLWWTRAVRNSESKIVFMLAA